MLSEIERQALIEALNEDQRLALFIVVSGLSEQPHKQGVNSPAVFFRQALNLLSQNNSFNVHIREAWIEHLTQSIHIYTQSFADFNQGVRIWR